MATPREHVDEIRRIKFSIGGQPNPLTEDLHQAVKNLSAELYTKDVHFLMELIQNAEDNEYLDGVKPSLEFVITSRDITATGAPATLLMFNNERGFSPKNIESICSVGRSTKKGNRKRGYIGEKGIGFKSVFLITAQPCIFSNGYQIRFNEGPSTDCNVGFIVPEWIEGNPTLSVIKEIYGSGTDLPTTTILLPLKADKVKPVKQQLSSIHPEVLLFLSKIKRLSIREHNEDPMLNTVNAISISSEINFVTRKNIDAESYMLHLSAGENGDDCESECGYHMWRQRFPVRLENIVERRMEVEEWVITLAFPNGERLNRGGSSPGMYAFLPTEMVTNFPFIIQADFLLVSSRETILLDNIWNQGILDCVSTAFVNAFTSLVKSTVDAPVSSLLPMFGFLPVENSSYAKLNDVRESIKAKLVDESIIPGESYTEQRIFHKPSEVGRLAPTFWTILNKARMQGVSLYNLSSHGWYIISSSFDSGKYSHVWNFLGVKSVNIEWYTKCIQSSNLVLGVSEDVYLSLLLFLANNWSKFQTTNIESIPLLKLVDFAGNVSLCCVNDVSWGYIGTLLLASESHLISWMINWNKEFRCAGDQFFMPESAQEAMLSSSKFSTLLKWLLDQVKVSSVDVYQYSVLLRNSVANDRKLAVAFAHFLYHSLSNNYLSERQVSSLCNDMKIVDNYGRLCTRGNGVLVPANGSKWVELIGSNPWRNEGYVELGEDYLWSQSFAAVRTRAKELIIFLRNHVGASDIPDLSPPNAVIPTVSSLLTKQNALLLLGWICNLRRRGSSIPEKFLRSIKEGAWLKISLSGSPGVRPPSQSFLLTSSWGNLLQNGSVLVDIPLIDQTFYENKIDEYRDELRSVGVMFEFGEACQFIGNHLMSLAASSTLTKANVLSILNFIKFLRERLLPPENFIDSIKNRRWMRTSQGVRAPVEAVLFDSEWRAASQISDIPFLDDVYYGEEIHSFKTELQLLGVTIGFNESYQLVLDHLKSPGYLTSQSTEAILLILSCIRHVKSSNKLANALKGQKCIKTNMGYKSPSDCFLFNPKWGCLLRVFNGFPIVDEKVYGRKILLYSEELKQLGVIVEFEAAAKSFANVFRQQASSSSITKDNVFSLLSCYRQLVKKTLFPSELKKCIRDVKWLRTRLGDYRVPKDCVLFGPDWEFISMISLLPFIDDSKNYYGKGIHKYKEELQSMGVVAAYKEGAKFVASSLFLPRNPSAITPASVHSLLECIWMIPPEQNEPLLAVISEKVALKWLRTSAGYRSPDDCLLFGSDLVPFLKRVDGPFIDEKFYGPKITSYRKELSAIGVTVDVEKGCPLIASYLECHSNFGTINRIYNYLNEFNWEPEVEDAKKVWIPNGSDDGVWESPDECVLYDEHGLFGLQLRVLDKHYDETLLNFFFRALKVKATPSVDDYCQLWKGWESSGHCLSRDECCAFWQFVVEQWNPETQKSFTESLSKLPVYSSFGGVHLFDKCDVFIGDDLYLKDLFEKSSSQSLFVWYPNSSLQSLPRTKLLEIYGKIGARPLSQIVKKTKSSRIDDDGLMKVSLGEAFIRRGLIRLILAFLADISPEMEAKKLEAVKQLLNVTVFETRQPITTEYSLSLSSGEVMNVKATRMIRWERESSKFFMHKMDSSTGQKCIMEYATYFSEVVSEGLLWEQEDHVHQLAELIKLGFLVEFDEDAVKFLLKTKNLQIFSEDEDFLASAFSV